MPDDVRGSVAEPLIADAGLQKERTRAAPAETSTITKKPDKTYAANYKRFVQFCNASGFVGPPYLTRATVDRYFEQVVQHLPVNEPTVRRIVPSLQWFADYKEYCCGNTTAETKFVVASQRTKLALDQHNMERNQQREMNGAPAFAQHENLPEFPNHPASKKLPYVQPERYPDGASKARQEGAAQMIRTREQCQQMNALNAVLQASFDRINKTLEKVAQGNAEMETRWEARFERLGLMIQAKQSVAPPTETTNSQQQPVIPSPVVAHCPSVASTPSEESSPVEHSLLPPGPPVPDFPTETPKSVLEHLEQHIRYNLESFRNSSKKHWPDSRRQAFSRRLKVYDAIATKAATYRPRKEEETAPEKQLYRAAAELQPMSRP